MKYGLADKYLKAMFDTINKFDEIEEVYLFGSRATGKHKVASDIDLAIKGRLADNLVAQQLKEALEETDIPYFFDVVSYNNASDELKVRIDADGVRLK